MPHPALHHCGPGKAVPGAGFFPKLKGAGQAAEMNPMSHDAPDPTAVHPPQTSVRPVRRQVLYLALGLALLGYTCSRWVIMPVQVSGESMAPSYEDGQPNFINKLAYRSRHPQRGDVVGLSAGRGDLQLKRIIGLPGEKVEFRRGTVVVNGEALHEPYVLHDLLWWLPSVQLGPKDYFVMGDNRRVSVLGSVPEGWIIGKAMF